MQDGAFKKLFGLFKIQFFKVGNYQHLFSGNYESKLESDGDFLNHHGKISIRIKPNRFGSVPCIAVPSVSEG